MIYAFCVDCSVFEDWLDLHFCYKKKKSAQLGGLLEMDTLDRSF